MKCPKCGASLVPLRGLPVEGVFACERMYERGTHKEASGEVQNDNPDCDWFGPPPEITEE